MYDNSPDYGVQTRGTRVRKRLRAFHEAADQLQAQKRCLNLEEPRSAEVLHGIDRLMERYESLRDAQVDLFSYALDSLSRKIARLESTLEQVSPSHSASGVQDRASLKLHP